MSANGKPLFNPDTLVAQSAILKKPIAELERALGKYKSTIRKVFEGQDTKYSTILKVADELNCDVNLTFTPRPTEGDAR